jgi:hypothetical protein
LAGRDITEGRGDRLGPTPDNPSLARAIATDIGIVSDGAIWQNTDINYDVAIGGLPFIYAINDNRPYIRQTAPFRKEQFDNQTEPGEQSLTGWWIRSQSSFHGGTGITYFDPQTSDEFGHYRYSDSKGVDVFEDGEVTLLNDVNQSHNITGQIRADGRPSQAIRSIKYGTTAAVLVLDEYDVDKIFPRITVSITNKALTSNVATLTTSAAHGLSTNMQIIVSNVGSPFDGEYRITGVPTATTFTYSKTATDFTSAAVSPAGTGTAEVVHFIDYNSGSDTPVFAICDDGTFAYWITNTATKKTVYKKPLTGSSASTADVVTMFDEIGLVSNATMEYVKDRIVMCADNKVYEFSTSASAMPTPVYTHPTTTHVYTSITASGPAIYVAGYNGIQSTIQKFTLGSNGVMPTLSAAVVAAELPVGEICHRIFYYLGFMLIGTNKGIRAAQVNDQDGSVVYGPLFIKTDQPCYDFAARDRFVWCATSVSGEPGVIRIDLGTEIDNLIFAYANDVYKPGVTGHQTVGCAFVNGTEQMAFVTTATASTNGYVYVENMSELTPTGYLTTGNIRYNTLEKKNFKRLLGRGNFTFGSMSLNIIAENGTTFDVISYDASVGSPEVTTSSPSAPQEYVAYKFQLFRDGTDSSKGPNFKGYQAKATIATPRQRIVQFPVYCYDIETDRYNVLLGYEGRAFDKIRLLEDIEATGDVVTWQDLTTGESRQAVIEQVTFTRLTPPDKRFDGFGGVLQITIRTV